MSMIRVVAQLEFFHDRAGDSFELVKRPTPYVGRHPESLAFTALST